MLCRYKLTSQGFLARLLHVRSIMKYADVERIPAAVNLMREMLWVESPVVEFDETMRLRPSSSFAGSVRLCFWKSRAQKGCCATKHPCTT